jgi:hypothetical protein
MINVSPDALLIGTLERRLHTSEMRLHTSTIRVHQLESELQEVRNNMANLERMLTTALETISKRPPPLPTHALPLRAPRLTQRLA